MSASYHLYLDYPEILANPVPRDIQVLKTYGAAPYAAALKNLEKQIKEKQTSVNEKIGVKVYLRTRS
jgi:26S proteasome regulatory subunit T1